jgi:DNA-binding GntR family transcriptional regulator
MVLKGTRVSIGPDWQKVADDLRARIASGEYPLESKIPSTAKLQAAYSASSTVVRQAVRELQHDGVLTGRPGKGVFVAALPEGRNPDAGSERLDAVEMDVMALYRKLGYEQPSRTQDSGKKAPHEQAG